MLAIETEANGAQEGGHSLVDSLACRAGTRDFGPALAALVGPVQNIFFLTEHYFTSFVPIIQHAGQAVVPRRLSLNMCLWSWNTFKGPDRVMQSVTKLHTSIIPSSDLNLKPKLMKMGEGGGWDGHRVIGGASGIFSNLFSLVPPLSVPLKVHLDLTNLLAPWSL